MTEKVEPTARILAVDDEQSIRDVLKAGLTRAGYECITAESADYATLQLDQEAIDLVLLDINMPGKTGIEYLPELKERHPGVAVIMLTGETDISTAVRAMREGAYDYALKPVSFAELIIRIEHALSRQVLALENKTYQQRLEQMVDELNVQKRQRERELGALNRLFQSHIQQNETAQVALHNLQEALSTFTSELDGLATTVGISRQAEVSDR